MVTRPTHDPTHSVASAAAIIGVSASQVRNWAAQFATKLSPMANPGPGQPRQLTPADVAMLQRVAELRAAGVDYADIAAQLPAPDTLPAPYIDVPPAPMATTAQKAPEATIGHVELISALDGRFSAMQAQITQLQQTQAATDRRRLTMITVFLLGLVGGMVLVVAVWAVFALAARLGG